MSVPVWLIRNFWKLRCNAAPLTPLSPRLVSHWYTGCICAPVTFVLAASISTSSHTPISRPSKGQGPRKQKTVPATSQPVNPRTVKVSGGPKRVSLYIKNEDHGKIKKCLLIFIDFFVCSFFGHFIDFLFAHFHWGDTGALDGRGEPKYIRGRNRYTRNSRHGSTMMSSMWPMCLILVVCT